MKPFALACLLSVSAISGSFAQRSYYDDAEVRAHFSLETKLNRRWTLHLDQQYRFGENVSRLTRGSGDIGLTYKVSKHVKLLGDYTFIQAGKRNGSFATRHWFSGALMLRGDVDRWRFVYRNMVQLRNGDMNSEEQYLSKLYDRNKLSIRYEATKRFTFYTAGEIYIPLNNPQVEGIDRSRNFLGVLIRTFRHQELELYFMYQHQWQKGGWWDQSDRYPDPHYNRDFIFGIGYGIEI